MPTPTPDEETDFGTEDSIDRLCTAFERSLKSGSYQNLEDWVRRVPESQRAVLSQRLEIIYREYLGNDPTPTSAGTEDIDSGPGTVNIDPHNVDQFGTEKLPTKSEKSQQVGPYKLLQKIGEGGMGEVWAADQTAPVKRRVAVKLIKSDVDSRRVAARFEVERQALALMNHPNIAKVLDAGTTDDGRPYFVMELVEGLPFNKYCDEHKLSITQRLELFVTVCQAVQHAHQKGIIHRDLKPSNVLVCQFDGKPVAKVIDFGLAKALQSNQLLTDKTVFTEFGQVVGTLQYMSPEQAEMKQVDIDTRTDIYSLGVMLYETLTGSTPVDSDTLRQQAVLHVLAVIREQDPPRPSAKLSSNSQEKISQVSTLRNIYPSKLRTILRGELDWIVMKALEKDRNRRYETASGFAADIQRHLNNEPILARPPSWTYLCNRFVRKHRLVVSSLAAIFLALIVGFAGTSWGLKRALNAELLASQKADSEKAARIAEVVARAETEQAFQQARDTNKQLIQESLEKERALANEQIARRKAEVFLQFFRDDFLALTSVEGQARFDDFSPNILGREATLGDLLDRATEKLEANSTIEPLAKAELLWTLGVNYRGAGNYEQAVKLLDQAVSLREVHLPESDLELLNARMSLAVALGRIGDVDRESEIYQQIYEVASKHYPPENYYCLSSRVRLARNYLDIGKTLEALQIAESAYSVSLEKLGENHESTLEAMDALVSIYDRTDQGAKALPLAERALEIVRQSYPDNYFYMGKRLKVVAAAERGLGNYKRALELYEECQKYEQVTLGMDHPTTQTTMAEIATLHLRMSNPMLAKEMLEKLLPLTVQTFGEDHSETLATQINLATTYRELKMLEEAVALYRKSIATMNRTGDNDAMGMITTMNNLAATLNGMGQFEEATEVYSQLLPRIRQTLGESHQYTLVVLNNLARLYENQGSHDKALPLYEEAAATLRETIGPNHPTTLAISKNLATALAAVGQLQDAEALYRELSPIMEAELGECHTTTLACKWGLAELLQSDAPSDSEFEEAVALIEAIYTCKDRPVQFENIGWHLLCAYSQAKRADDSKRLVVTLLAELIADERFDGFAFALRKSEFGEQLIKSGAVTDGLRLLEGAAEETSKLLESQEDMAWQLAIIQVRWAEGLLCDRELEQDDNENDSAKERAGKLLSNATDVLTKSESVPSHSKEFARKLLERALRQQLQWALDDGNEEAISEIREKLRDVVGEE